ncbi:MAG: hypothetical protein J0G29_01005 [Alphaproteobacteria bacterium]|nr:hypothetical protein [Alphaproteobacteria bacterium]OJV47140.1 MAG: hypothetical protein BGO28_01725 [Alphaproteobacteria bacterium 43-37]
MKSKKILLSTAFSLTLLSAIPNSAQAITWAEFREGASRVWAALTSCVSVAPAIRQSIGAAVVAINPDAADEVARLQQQADALHGRIVAGGTAVAAAASTLDEALAGTRK